MITEAKRSNHNRHYIRLDIVNIDCVFQAITTSGYFRGISVTGKRYLVFLMSGPDCVACGIQGKYFAIERDRGSNKYHMNLYAIDSEGYEVMMTRDHIVPRSKGGPDNLDNQQTMCIYCNQQKGNHHEESPSGKAPF